MHVYIFLFFLLMHLYISPLLAGDNKQDVVAPMSSSPVFMPLDKYRHHKAVNPSQEVYIPLKPRYVPKRASKKIIEPAIIGPEYGPPYVPPAQMRKAMSVPTTSKPAQSPAKMTPEQAKQILSIYGTGH